MKYIFLLLVVFQNGCVNSNPQASYADAMDLIVEQKRKITEYPYSLMLRHLTHVTDNGEGNCVYHFFHYEYKEGTYIIPFLLREKETIGKCMVYYVVDPLTDVIIDWGYDEGSNPKTCRLTG